MARAELQLPKLLLFDFDAFVGIPPRQQNFPFEAGPGVRNIQIYPPFSPLRRSSAGGRSREAPHPVGQSVQPAARRHHDGVRHAVGHGPGPRHGGAEGLPALPAVHQGPVGRRGHPERLRSSAGVPAGEFSVFANLIVNADDALLYRASCDIASFVLLPGFGILRNMNDSDSASSRFLITINLRSSIKKVGVF